MRKKSNFFHDNKPFLSLPSNDIEKGYKLLNKYGIEKKLKFTTHTPNTAATWL